MMMTPKWEVRVSDLVISLSRRSISASAVSRTPLRTTTSSGLGLNPVLPEPSPSAGSVVEVGWHSSDGFAVPLHGSDVLTVDAANKIIKTRERSAKSQPARLRRVFEARLVANAVVPKYFSNVSVDCDKTLRCLLHLCHAAANLESCT